MTARLYRWFAADAEAEGHESPLVVGHFCPTCGTRLDKADRPCPMGCGEVACVLPPAWCLCGIVDDRGDGTCGNCGLRIMTDDDDFDTGSDGAA